LSVVCILAVAVIASGAVAFASDSPSVSQPWVSSTASIITGTVEAPVSSAAEDEFQGVGVSDAYPDYTPLPKRVSTQRALQLGELALATVEGAGLRLVDSFEIIYPDTTVTQIVLGPVVADQMGIVIVSVFSDPSMSALSSVADGGAFGQLKDRAAGPVTSAQRIVVPGAVDACVITSSLLPGCQALACLSDQTVVNICSEGHGTSGKAPLDWPAVERLLAAVVEQI